MIILGYLVVVIGYAIITMLAVTTALVLYGGAWVILGIAVLLAKIVGSSWRPRRHPQTPVVPRRKPQAAYSNRR